VGPGEELEGGKKPAVKGKKSNDANWVPQTGSRMTEGAVTGGKQRRGRKVQNALKGRVNVPVIEGKTKWWP